MTSLKELKESFGKNFNPKLVKKPKTKEKEEEKEEKKESNESSVSNFKGYLIESSDNDLSIVHGSPKTDHLNKYVFQFLQHLTSSAIGLNDHEINTEHARPLLGEEIIHDEYVTEEIGDKGLIHPTIIQKQADKVEKDKEDAHHANNEARIKSGQHPLPYPSIRHRMKEGFHAAMPEGEHPDVTKQKAKESVKHFHEFMHKEGGHAKTSKPELLGQNGKTASSTGAGINTVGLSISPSTGARSGERKKGEFDVCPNSTKECRKNCLGWTAGGNNQYKETADRAKLLRKRYMTEHPEHAARVLSHEISKNEDYADKHHTIHDKSGAIIGHKNKKTGVVKSENPKKMSHEEVKKGLDSGEHHERPLKSGVRLNVTSDLQHHRLHPKSFFDRHHKSDFYDYTKNHGSLDDENKPKNYTHGLSHTGDSHAESNSHEVINHLRKGHIAAMVYQRGKDQPEAKRVKVHGSPEGHDEWKVVNGDDDDNLHTRHESAAQEHDAHAAHHHAMAQGAASTVASAHKAEAAKHEKLASEYRAKKHGVVSGLKLKGVTNEKAGNFANKVDHTGTIWLHDHGTQANLRKTMGSDDTK